VITVLLIEDNPGDARLIRELLAEADGDGFQVWHADCLSAGLQRLAQGNVGDINVILLDLSLPDSIGLDTFARVEAQSPLIPIVVLTGLDDGELAAHAIRAGAQDYLSKAEMGTSLLARSLRYAIERKEADKERERLLAENQRRAAELDAVIHHLPASVLVYDKEGKIVRKNPAAERSTGYTTEEGLLPLRQRGGLLEYLQEDEQPLRLEDSPLFRALAGESVAGMVVGVRQRGQEPIRWLHSSSAPIRNSDGTQIGAVVTSTNITALKELDRLKDEFLSIAAHELRTPMTAMKGYAQLLQRWAREMPDAQRWVRPLQTIDQQVNRMTDLVERLLDVSRIQLGRMEVILQPVDLVRIIEEAAMEAQISTDNHQIEVMASLPELQGSWDATRLQQVISNLLSNAIRYSPGGGRIEVQVTRDQTKAVVSVKDEGPGISPEAIPHLFERNYRADEATRTHRGGMGLGLYVAKGIIDAHGGQIWVESEIGRGSTFYFALPMVYD
jgi:two-component system, OmpR family, phosphate regulon sensor histidine kinase PhoR